MDTTAKFYFPVYFETDGEFHTDYILGTEDEICNFFSPDIRDEEKIKTIPELRDLPSGSLPGDRKYGFCTVVNRYENDEDLDLVWANTPDELKEISSNPGEYLDSVNILEEIAYIEEFTPGIAADYIQISF